MKQHKHNIFTMSLGGTCALLSVSQAVHMHGDIVGIIVMTSMCFAGLLLVLAEWDNEKVEE